ncbi:MAG TPA: LemA family protein [Ohtaekwangia sp.]|uniref:LemA family protein n=1 Tax=Ohtaekwangia sp. TaxID=2066019 RepID=UPI002F947F7A
MRTLLSGIIITSCAFICWNCDNKKVVTDQTTTFTRIDSLTDYYLALQDSMLQSWNIMIYDDNQKIKSMHNLLHELMVSSPERSEEFAAYEQRLDQLVRLRYTQKTMANTDVVEEYDFASNSLVTELLSLAESQPQFNYNTTLQKLADEIQLADQRVNNYREEYDAIVATYNRFLEKYRADIKDIDTHSSLEKRPMFQMVSDE